MARRRIPWHSRNHARAIHGLWQGRKGVPGPEAGNDGTQVYYGRYVCWIGLASRNLRHRLSFRQMARTLTVV
jgi:hypothetical protein